MANSNDLHNHCANLILTLIEDDDANVCATDVEAVCNNWQGVGSFVCNLIRSANDRGIAVTIDHISGGVEISEPVGESVHADSFDMVWLLLQHFDALQADALRFLQMELPMINLQPDKHGAE